MRTIHNRYHGECEGESKKCDPTLVQIIGADGLEERAQERNNLLFGRLVETEGTEGNSKGAERCCDALRLHHTLDTIKRVSQIVREYDMGC